MPSDERQVLAICLTIMLCITFSMALDSWTAICLGICMGMPFGLFGSEEDEEGGKGHEELDR